MSAPQDFSAMLSGQHPQFPSGPSGQNTHGMSGQQPGMQELGINGPLPSPMAAVAAATAPRQGPDRNPPTLCRMGQEAVQEVMNRTLDIFQTLRALQLPNGSVSGSNQANDKKNRVQEQLRFVGVLLKRIRVIYDKCCDSTKNLDMSYTHVETLIPLKEEWDGKSDERKNTEAYRQEVAEREALKEQLSTVNKEIKDALDLMRLTVWEINSMLAMRRT